MDRTVRNHEAAAAAELAILIGTGTDEKIDLVRSEKFVAGEVTCLNQAFGAKLQDVTVEDADLFAFRNQGAGRPGEPEDGVGHQFTVELPVAQCIGVLLRVAQSVVGGVEALRVGGNTLRLRFAAGFDPLPVAIEFLERFAAVGIVHPLVGGAAGEDVALDQMAVFFFGVADQ